MTTLEGANNGEYLNFLNFSPNPFSVSIWLLPLQHDLARCHLSSAEGRANEFSCHCQCKSFSESILSLNVPIEGFLW